MLYVNESTKNCMLYGKHGIKYVLMPGDTIDSELLPEVASHPAFKPKKEMEATPVVSTDFDASSIMSSLATLEEKVAILQATVSGLAKELSILQIAVLPVTQEPAKEGKKTTREPKA